VLALLGDDARLEIVDVAEGRFQDASANVASAASAR
jgi:hypothetical protein